MRIMFKTKSKQTRLNRVKEENKLNEHSGAVPGKQAASMRKQGTHHTTKECFITKTIIFFIEETKK